jgi:large subunit ribosomal protein L13
MRGTKQKSFVASSKTLQQEWFVVDAKDMILGRLATQIAMVLMGKHKPIYTPFLDTGDFVVVLNADKIKLTGKKAEKKFYKRFSGYPGGQREVPYAEEMAKHPDVVVLHAVKSMLPRGTLGRQQITKLKVYKGTDHPHQAQKCKPLEIK